MITHTPNPLLKACLKAKKARASYLTAYFRVNQRYLIDHEIELDKLITEQVELDTEIDILEYEIERRLIEVREARKNRKASKDKE